MGFCQHCSVINPMSQRITLEDIYRLFQAARAIEHDRRMREHEQFMAEQKAEMNALYLRQKRKQLEEN